MDPEDRELRRALLDARQTELAGWLGDSPRRPGINGREARNDG